MLQPGAWVGEWQVVELLGRGAYGAAYLVRHRTSGLRAALKLIMGEVGPEELARVEREVRALSSIRHPGVVALHDHGRHAGSWFLVMELVEGETLEALVRREGPLPVERACAIVEALAQACEAVHRVALVHRDIKPENVLIGRDGHARLIDFGLVRPLGAGIQSLTATGMTVGTPAYMAPEQVEGRPVGPPVDVYALGGTLYFALTGHPPFTDASALAVMNAVLQGPPPPPSQLRSGLPPEVERVCLRCLEKSPAARYASAQALARALSALLGDSRPRAVVHPPRALPVPALVALGLVLAGGVGAAALWRSRSVAVAPPATPPSAPPVVPAPEVAPPVDEGRFKEPRIAEAVRELERGNALEQQGDPAGALVAYDRVVELAPDRAMGYTNRGNQRRLKQDLRGAQEDLDRAVALEPRSHHARHNRGLLRQETRDLRGAIADWTVALETRPDSVPTLYLRGYATFELGDAEGAVRDLSRALEVEPGNVACLVARGLIRGQGGDAPGALADFARATEADPRNGKAWASSALVRYQTRDLAGALADAERALQVMAPNDPYRRAAEEIRANAKAELGR